MKPEFMLITVLVLFLKSSRQVPVTVKGTKVPIVVPGLESSKTFTNTTSRRASNFWTITSGQPVSACSVLSTDISDAYLIMRYIQTAPAEEVTICVHYRLRCCRSSSIFRLSIGLYAFLGSNMFNIPNPNSLSYAYIGELRNTSVMQGTSKMLFSSEKTVGMKGHGGLYIAFRDRGICGSVESVEVYYYTCPLRGGQMQFQATVAPNSSTGVLRISGSCTDNSIPEAGEDNNFLLCYSNGTAIVYGKCHCSSGYQNLSLSSCRDCPPKTFKEIAGNFPCRRCGANVVDGRLPRNTPCDCMAGFYRPVALRHAYQVNCEEPPSRPRHLKATNTSSTWVLLSWTKPIKKGTGSYPQYEISYNNKQFTTENSYFNLTGLSSFTYYDVAVTSITNVTRAINIKNHATASFRTASGYPSAVQNLRLTWNFDFSVTIHWQEPAIKGGNDLQYYVVINGDAGRFMNSMNFTIYQKDETKHYLASVRSHTKAGFSDEESISFTIQGGASDGISVQTAMGIGGSLAAVLIIIIISCLVIYIRDRRKRKMLENSAVMNLTDIQRRLGIESSNNGAEAKVDKDPEVIANKAYQDLPCRIPPYGNVHTYEEVK